jgi:outer membrane protein OmpA-like peptidoglycan-associated protein
MCRNPILKHMRAAFVLILLLSFLCQPEGISQTVELSNPSFEDEPHIGKIQSLYNARTTIKDWADCGSWSESPPDIHPSGGFPDTLEQNGWEVAQPSRHGKTFLGMVVRDNDSYEAISQPLQSPFKKGTCYAFSIHLSASDQYLSQSRTTGQMSQFTKAAVFRLWGGTGPCETIELLAESGPVDHSEWRNYTFKIEPRRDYSWVRIEAFYQTPSFMPYNGHILVDHASAFQPIDCELPANQLAQKEDSPEPAAPRPSKPGPQSSGQPDKTQPEPAVTLSKTEQQTPASSETVKKDPPKERIIKELEEGKIAKGQVIRLDKLYFPADSEVIEPESFELLEELFVFLSENPKVRVEIGGHTNTIPDPEWADYLSLERAKSVASYLIEKGISTNRLETKGYGKNKPIIANDRLSRYAQQKNQRVEIMILSLGD